jgi:hypothetical protein
MLTTIYIHLLKHIMSHITNLFQLPTINQHIKMLNMFNNNPNKENKKQLNINLRDISLPLRYLKKRKIQHFLQSILSIKIDLRDITLLIKFLKSRALHLRQIDHKAKDNEILHRPINNNHINIKL